MSLAYVMLLLSILFGVVGQIALKQGMVARPEFRLSELTTLLTNIPILAGFTSYGISILLYFKALEGLDLSVAYPTVSLGYGFVIALSRVAFKERITPGRWLAVILICIGVALVGLGAS